MRCASSTLFTLTPFVLLLPQPCAAAPPRYQLLDIGAFTERPSSGAFAINTSGRVVGYSVAAPLTDMAFTYAAGQLTHLGVLPGKLYSVALDVNDAGQVVGTSGGVNGGAGGNRAFLYANGTMSDIGTLPGTQFAEAYGINGAGRIVGYCYSGGTDFRAFTYANGTMSELGQLAASTQSLAYDVNAVGQAVGTCHVPGVGQRAVLYANGSVIDLGGFAGATNNNAFAINDAGHVAGFSGSDLVRAVVYRNGTITDLGVLPGTTRSFSTDINASDEVVGFCDIPNSLFPRAYVHTGGQMLDLTGLLVNGPGWNVLQARGINDAGQIVGWALNPAGQQRAVLLTPIPEPGTPLLALAGVATAAGRRRARATRERIGQRPSTSDLSQPPVRSDNEGLRGYGTLT